VTSGGIVGKVVKVLEGNEIMVEIAEEVRVKVVKHTLLDVRTKTDTASDGAAKTEDKK
jgi:preprotein translocase subunit YajC